MEQEPCRSWAAGRLSKEPVKEQPGRLVQEQSGWLVQEQPVVVAVDVSSGT